MVITDSLYAEIHYCLIDRQTVAGGDFYNLPVAYRTIYAPCGAVTLEWCLAVIRKNDPDAGQYEVCISDARYCALEWYDWRAEQGAAEGEE